MKLEELRRLLRKEIRSLMKEEIKTSQLKRMKDTVGWISEDGAPAYDIPTSWPQSVREDAMLVSFEKGSRQLLSYAREWGASAEDLAELKSRLEKLKNKGTEYVLYSFEYDLNLGVL